MNAATDLDFEAAAAAFAATVIGGHLDPEVEALIAKAGSLRDQPDKALPLLERAYQLLQTQASRISDPRMRRSFLENVAAHAQIVKDWEARLHRRDAERAEKNLKI